MHCPVKGQNRPRHLYGIQEALSVPNRHRLTGAAPGKEIQERDTRSKQYLDSKTIPSTEIIFPTEPPRRHRHRGLATWRAPLSCASVEIVVLRVLLPGVIESAMSWHKKCTYLLWSLDKCASSLFVLLASFKSECHYLRRLPLLLPFPKYSSDYNDNARYRSNSRTKWDES